MLATGAALALALVAIQGGITGHRWADALIGVAALLTVIPATTRGSAAVLAGLMMLVGLYGLATGQSALQQPVRALMFCVLYAALALDSLLVLRVGAGLSLFLFFGTTKIGWVVTGQTSGFEQLIRAVGFPVAPLFTTFAILNETVTPLLVVFNIVTRPAAIVGALGMTGALYTSLRLGEDAGRAATYLVAFAVTAIAVPPAPSSPD